MAWRVPIATAGPGRDCQNGQFRIQSPGAGLGLGIFASVPSSWPLCPFHQGLGSGRAFWRRRGQPYLGANTYLHTLWPRLPNALARFIRIHACHASMPWDRCDVDARERTTSDPVRVLRILARRVRLYLPNGHILMAGPIVPPPLAAGGFKRTMD